MRSRTDQFFQWCRAFVGWLFEIRKFRLFWGTVGLIIVSLALVLWLKSEKSFRITGLALQIAGILTVVWNIRGTRKRFGKPSIWEFARQWIGRLPKYKGNTIILGSGHISGVSGMMTGRPEVWNHPPSNATPDRLAAIETNLDWIRKRLNELDLETREKLKRHAERLDQEMQTRTVGDQDIRDRLAISETGGLSLSVAGIVFLIVGLVMSTASVELANILQENPRGVEQVEQHPVSYF